MKVEFSFFQFFVLILYLKYVKLVPDEYCIPPLNKSDCGTPPTPVFSYYKFGSRCEIETWRGCPTKNMFESEYLCSHYCIGRLQFYGRERGSSIDDLTLTELEEINRILHKVNDTPAKREKLINKSHKSPKTNHKTPDKDASKEHIDDTTEDEDDSEEDKHNSKEDNNNSKEDNNNSKEDSNESTGDHDSKEESDETTNKDKSKEVNNKAHSTKAAKHESSEESGEYDEIEVTVIPLTQSPVTGTHKDTGTALKLRHNES